jgi:hypothetical protein
MEDLKLLLGKPHKENKNTGVHRIYYKNSPIIDVWFSDLFGIKTSKEAAVLANKILQTLKNK